MKITKTISLLLAGLLLAGVFAAKPAQAGLSFDFFYSNLSPHGSWHVSGSYGRVWQPSVYHTGWNPYYDGHWVYTDLGWCWNSDYAWGSIPYHYGTWAYDDFYGWVWVPGYTWAPAWVTFREGPGYIGWAPVSPQFSVGVSFNFGHFGPDHFVFVRSGDFLCDRVRSYAVPSSVTVINRTKIINNNITVVNNTVVNRGPSVSFVENATRRRVQAVSVDRVRGTALPGRSFDRSAIRVQPDEVRRGIRAAEPVSASRRLPGNAASIEDRPAGVRRDERIRPRGQDRREGQDALGSEPQSRRSNGGFDRPRRQREEMGPVGDDPRSPRDARPSIDQMDRAPRNARPRADRMDRAPRSERPSVDRMDRAPRSMNEPRAMRPSRETMGAPRSSRRAIEGPSARQDAYRMNRNDRSDRTFARPRGSQGSGSGHADRSAGRIERQARPDRARPRHGHQN